LPSISAAKPEPPKTALEADIELTSGASIFSSEAAEVPAFDKLVAAIGETIGPDFETSPMSAAGDLFSIADPTSSGVESITARGGGSPPFVRSRVIFEPCNPRAPPTAIKPNTIKAVKWQAAETNIEVASRNQSDRFWG